jgi:hypothetical protein
MEVCEFECEIGLTSGGGLSGIDVADNDDVDVHLFLTGKKRMCQSRVHQDREGLHRHRHDGRWCCWGERRILKDLPHDGGLVS